MQGRRAGAALRPPKPSANFRASDDGPFARDPSPIKQDGEHRAFMTLLGALLLATTPAFTLSAPWACLEAIGERRSHLAAGDAM
jgi:hypothetical protein